MAKCSTRPVSQYRPSQSFHVSKSAACFLAAKTGKHWADHGKHLRAGPCLVLEQGLTRHLVIVDGLHHQLGVLDTVDDAQQCPCQAQQLAEAVEAEVDEVVGKADDLGKDKATPDPAVLGAEQEKQTWSRRMPPQPPSLQRQPQPNHVASCNVPAGLAPQR